MRKYDIAFMMVSETHIPKTHAETREEFIWYFSGLEAERLQKEGIEKAIYDGVAVVVNNKWTSIIKDIERTGK